MSSKPTRPQRSFSSQILFFGIVQIITTLRGLILLPVFSKIIGVVGYGQVGGILTLAGLIQALVLLGANTSLNVFIPGQDEEIQRREFWGVTQSTVGITLFVYCGLLIFGPQVQKALLPKEIGMGLYVLGITLIPINSLYMMLYAHVVNIQEGAAFARLSTGMALVEIVVSLIGATYWGANGVLLGIIIPRSLTCLLLVRLLTHIHPFSPFHWDQLPNLRKYYTYGFNMFVVGFAAWVVDSSDRFIIGKTLSIEDLGVYQVVYSLSSNLHLLAGPFFATLMPFIVRAVEKNDPQAARRYLEQVYKMLLFIFLPAVILYTLHARDMLLLLTTSDFATGASTVPFIASGIAIYQTLGVYTYNLHAHKRGRVLIASVGLAAGLNLLLNFVFVPKYGIIAAAVSTFLAYGFMFMVDWAFSRQSLRFGLALPVISRLAVASIALVIISVTTRYLLAPLPLIIRLGASLAAASSAYIGLLFLSGFFTPSEFQALKSVLRLG